jgi:osmotically-inducible protein OsmY
MSVLYPLAIVNTASITSLVKMAMYHRSISFLHTQVETNEGVVMLEGKARNTAEKDLVTQPVSDLHGVRSLKCQMAIEEAKSK